MEFTSTLSLGDPESRSKRSSSSCSRKTSKAPAPLASYSEQGVIARIFRDDPIRRETLSKQIIAFKDALSACSREDHSWQHDIDLLGISLLHCWEADLAHLNTDDYDNDDGVPVLEAADRRQPGASGDHFPGCSRQGRQAKKQSSREEPGGWRPGAQASAKQNPIRFNVTERIGTAWIHRIAEGNPERQERWSKQVSQFKRQLNGPSESVLRQLVVQRMALHLLQCTYAVTRFAEWWTCDPAIRSHLLRRMDATNRWLFSAIRAYGKVSEVEGLAILSAESDASRLEPGIRADQETRSTAANPPGASEPGPAVRATNPGNRARGSSTDSRSDASSVSASPFLNLSSEIESQCIANMTNLGPGIKNQLIEDANATRAALGGSSATLLEQLLIDRIVISKLQFFHANCLMQDTMDFSDTQARHARACMKAAGNRYQIGRKELAALQKKLGRSRTSDHAQPSKTRH